MGSCNSKVVLEIVENPEQYWQFNFRSTISTHVISANKALNGIWMKKESKISGNKSITFVQLVRFT